MDARTTNPAEWRYVSEGGATIVFSYIGPTHEGFSGTVIRLRKAPLEELSTPGYNQGDTGETDENEYAAELDDPTIAFQARVTSRLVSLEHLPRLESCRVSYRWLSDLAKLAEPFRPARRTLKDGIDTRKRRAVIATDLVGGNAAFWAIEIKPKWAFLPNPKYLSPDTLKVKTAFSRFVMHSHYRVVTGESTATPTYDPLDLFSSDETRVEKAFGALWDGWVSSDGSANNLRIFIGGKSVNPADIIKAHAPDFDLHTLKERTTSTILPILTQTHLLRDLAFLQSTLDSLDIEGLSVLWEQVHPDGTPLGVGEPEPTLDEWSDFVNEYLIRHPRLPSTLNLQSNAGEHGPEKDELRYHLLAYLMSATFKDCSVIVRFPVGDAAETASAEPSITAIDLDPKSVSRLAKWEQLDRAIAEAYAKREAP